MAPAVSERDIPSSYNVSYDGDTPQRHLSDFTVSSNDEKVSICALDDKEHNGDVYAKGVLVSDSKNLRNVTVGPLVEWCIEYAQEPNLWIRTRHSWYKLIKPAKEYTKIHELARRRYEICARLYILSTSFDEKSRNYNVFVQLLSVPYLGMKGYTEKEILAEKGFIISQFSALNEPEVAESTFMQELREKRSPGGRKSTVSKTKKEPAPPDAPSPSSNGTLTGSEPWSISGKLDEDALSRLMKRAEKFISQIMKNKHAYPFLAPVDPHRDGCYDYLERIRSPMDYGTIKRRLEASEYSSISDIMQDVRQVTLNCKEYNGDLHDFSKWASGLEQKFESQMRNAEEGELGTLGKRTTGKKRKASDSLPPTGKGPSKRSGPKASRKRSKGSPDLTPSAGSSVKDEDEELRKCARSQSEDCANLQITGSKYCSDECGLIVARKRLAELSKAGFSADDYVRAYITKALVHSRS